MEPLDLIVKNDKMREFAIECLAGIREFERETAKCPTIPFHEEADCTLRSPRTMPGNGMMVFPQCSCGTRLMRRNTFERRSWYAGDLRGSVHDRPRLHWLHCSVGAIQSTKYPAVQTFEIEKDDVDAADSGVQRETANGYCHVYMARQNSSKK